MYTLTANIGDVGLSQSLDAIADLSPFRELPDRGEIDDRPIEDIASWPKALAAAQREGRVDWDTSTTSAKLVYTNPRICPPRVEFQAPEVFGTIQDGIKLIEALPFEICSIGSIFAHQWAEMKIDRFCFGRGHLEHGWACAFRGKGHERLVSRRWLEFGPWRVVRRPGDLTLVQFHDLHADPETAARQARPGWERMGPSRTGGFLHIPYHFHNDIEGLYDAARRTLEIVVPPAMEVEQVHMRDACAVRARYGILPAEKPIDQVAYIFVDEIDARAHLHELWLRQLEVWLVDGAGKRRLDDTYAPTVNPPEWALRLDDRG